MKLLGGVPGSGRPDNPWADELARLVPPNFLETIPFAQIPHLPRYLKALLTRMERAALNPLKDQERVRLLAPYLATLQTVRQHAARLLRGPAATGIVPLDGGGV